MRKFSILIGISLLSFNCSYLLADESLNSIQNKILLLKTSIIESEKQIKLKNQEYNEVLNEMKVFDNKVHVLEQALYDYKQKVKFDFIKIQRSWNVLIMQQADSKRHSEYLLTYKKIMLDMKEKSQRIKQNIAWATRLEMDLALSLKTSNEIKMKADVLLGLIRRLEDNKLGLLGKVNEKSLRSERVENKNINTVLENTLAKGDYFINKNFTLPINKYTRFEHSEHGINFYFRTDSFLLAPSYGKVIYVGELSSYGNVIMIEHDKKIISVLLGDIQTTIDETSIVTQGSIIGKLSGDRDGGTKNLYYEIRKEEVPIPVLSYLKIAK